MISYAPVRFDELNEGDRFFLYGEGWVWKHSTLGALLRIGDNGYFVPVSPETECWIQPEESMKE